MQVTSRGFRGGADYGAVSEFLVGLYEPENRDGNWLQPIWQYAYTCPSFDEASISNLSIWVGLTHSA